MPWLGIGLTAVCVVSLLLVLGLVSLRPWRPLLQLRCVTSPTTNTALSSVSLVISNRTDRALFYRGYPGRPMLTVEVLTNGIWQVASHQEEYPLSGITSLQPHHQLLCPVRLSTSQGVYRLLVSATARPKWAPFTDTFPKGSLCSRLADQIESRLSTINTAVSISEPIRLEHESQRDAPYLRPPW